MKISTESYYIKKTDGFVYHYWRVVGHKTWNVQKTAVKEVPTIEMVTDIHEKVVSSLTPKKDGK